MNVTSAYANFTLQSIAAAAIFYSTQATAANVCVHPAGGKCHATVAAAIAAAAPGDTVTLAPGVYFEEAITINKPLTLKGSAKTIIDAGWIPDPNDTTQPIAQIHGSAHAVYVAANNVRIEGLTIRNSGFNAIQFNNDISDATISKVSIYNAGTYCIQAGQNNHNLSVIDSKLQSCRLDGISIRGNNVQIAKTRVQQTNGAGITVFGHGATVLQNQVSTAKSIAILVVGNDPLITNNAIANAGRHGIFTQGSNPVIAGNSVINAYTAAIYLECTDDCAAGRIVKNKISSTGQNNFPALYAYPTASGITIENNSLDGSGGNAIEIHGMGIATVSSNKIANSGSYAACIALWNAAHVIRGNQLSSCDYEGIAVYGSAAGAQILGNTINQVGTTGVFAGGDNVRVEGNKIANSAGFGVTTGAGSSNIAISGNQLKDNRAAICDAASGTTVGVNSGNGAVWDVGSTFGEQGITHCDYHYSL